jgi:hypothetical protein
MAVLRKGACHGTDRAANVLAARVEVLEKRIEALEIKVEKMDARTRRVEILQWITIAVLALQALPVYLRFFSP